MKNFENLNQVLNDTIDENYIKYIASIYFGFDYKPDDNKYIFVHLHTNSSKLPDPLNNINDLQDMIKICIDNYSYSKRLIDVLILKYLTDKMNIFKLFESITPEIIVRACALSYYLSEYDENQILEFYKESGINDTKLTIIKFIYNIDSTCNVLIRSDEKITVRNSYNYLRNYRDNNLESFFIDGKEYCKYKGVTYELEPEEKDDSYGYNSRICNEYPNWLEDRDERYWDSVAEGLISLNKVKKDENDPGFLSEEWDDSDVFNSHDFVEK